LDEAINHYRLAVEVDPDFAKAHINLGYHLSKKGQLNEAVSHYQQAIRVRPRDSAAINNLAWILATAKDPALRDSAEAVRLAEKACELTRHKNTVFLNTLAVAYASASRFDDAISTAEQALDLAESAGNESLAQQLKRRIKLFKGARSDNEKPAINDNIAE
jgi:Flp pilus assembly protein TadD